MKTVEHRQERWEGIPPVYWAEDIEVRDANGFLCLFGKRPLGSKDVDRRDLLKGHLNEIRTSNPKADTSSNSPHIAFANCIASEALPSKAQNSTDTDGERVRDHANRDGLPKEGQA